MIGQDSVPGGCVSFVPQHLDAVSEMQVAILCL